MAASESHSRRGWHTLILEAELVASSPEYVYHWFEKRATGKDGCIVLDASLDVEIQQALLRRRHPLIDLALARFTNEDEIALELFRRDADVVSVGHEERERTDSALKLAVLANKMLANPFDPVPGPLRLVGDHVSWLGAASTNEIAALFNNPTLGDGFLREFLEGSPAWTVLSDEHRRTAVACLSRNENLRHERHDSVQIGREHAQ